MKVFNPQGMLFMFCAFITMTPSHRRIFQICRASVGYAVTWFMSQRILIHLRGTFAKTQMDLSSY